MLYVYLLTSILVFAASSGPIVPRVALALIWLPTIAALITMVAVAVFCRFFDEPIHFDPARRVLRNLKRIRALAGAGVAS